MFSFLQSCLSLLLSSMSFRLFVLGLLFRGIMFNDKWLVMMRWEKRMCL